MMLLDSPLNRAGRLQIYIHTQRNVLIEVSPHIRIPRTFKRFCGLMGGYLYNMYIASVGRWFGKLWYILQAHSQLLLIANLAFVFSPSCSVV